MSMQVVIGMVIALLVLIVLITIFGGKAKTFATIDQCEQQGNTCKPGITGCDADTEYKVISKCPEDDQICCARKPGR